MRDPRVRDRQRWRIGIRVHPLGPGQDPLETGRAVGVGLPGLRWDTAQRINAATELLDADVDVESSEEASVVSRLSLNGG